MSAAYKDAIKPMAAEEANEAIGKMNKGIKIANDIYERYGIRTMSGLDDAWDTADIVVKGKIETIKETGEQFLISLAD